MKINLIWAQSSNGVIGNKGSIPWSLPEDMAHFKKMTLGQTVVMGRKTWDSLPAQFRPLPGRRNVVLTHNVCYHPEPAGAAKVIWDTDELYTLGVPGVWVIGGSQIYVDLLPRASRLVITELRDAYEGDSWSPVPRAWVLKGSKAWEGTTTPWLVSKTGLQYRILDYTKI